MALTSAERRSFQRIVADLRSDDRLFLWRTRVTTRRALWSRRQLCRVMKVGLMLIAALVALSKVGRRALRAMSSRTRSAGLRLVVGMKSVARYLRWAGPHRSSSSHRRSDHAD